MNVVCVCVCVWGGGGGGGVLSNDVYMLFVNEVRVWVLKYCP